MKKHWDSKVTHGNIDLQFEDADGTELFYQYAKDNKLKMEGCFCDIQNLKNADKGNDTDTKLSIMTYHKYLLAFMIEFRDDLNFAHRYSFTKNLSEKEKTDLGI